MIYTIRTTNGRETIVMDMLIPKIKSKGIDVKTVFHPAEIKGYIFAEGDLGAIQEAVRGVVYSKGVIEKEVKIDQIKHFLEHKIEKIKINEGDLVEIIGGPFKGEKGKIQRIDKVKNEVTIELLEASIPIPITITTEFIKVIKQKAKEEEEVTS